MTDSLIKYVSKYNFFFYNKKWLIEISSLSIIYYFGVICLCGFSSLYKNVFDYCYLLYKLDGWPYKLTKGNDLQVLIT